MELAGYMISSPIDLTGPEKDRVGHSQGINGKVHSQYPDQAEYRLPAAVADAPLEQVSPADRVCRSALPTWHPRR